MFPQRARRLRVLCLPYLKNQRFNHLEIITTNRDRKQQTQRPQTMSSEHAEKYVAIAKAMLDDVGIACTKWNARACSKNHFTPPILLYNLQERTLAAIKQERKRAKQTSEYTAVANNPVLEKQLMSRVKDQVLQSRARQGQELRAMARRLGHPESNRQFASGRKSRFILGTDCILCGIRAHDVPSCPEFLIAYETKHGQPYAGPAAITVPDYPPLLPRPVINIRNPAHKMIFTRPGQQVLVQGSFSGIGTLNADGSVKMELQLSSGHSSDGVRRVDLSGYTWWMDGWGLKVFNV